MNTIVNGLKEQPEKRRKIEKDHNLNRDYSYLVLPDCNF